MHLMIIILCHVWTVQAEKLKFFGTHPNRVVSYISYTKFHSPKPVFHSPGQIFTHIGERASASFPACSGISLVNLRWFNVKSARVSYFNWQCLPTFCLKIVAWHSLSITTFWIGFLNTLGARQNGCNFSDDIFLNKNDEFRLRFHWSLFLRVHLTIFQYCFR